MISALQKQLGPMLLGSCLALSLAAAAPANAEELRIGFIAPMTGIFAQIGKDMVNGFQMYLDEHGGKLGGAEVKFIVEDAKTPVVKISKQMKRTIGALRQQALKLGIGLGHQR